MENGSCRKSTKYKKFLVVVLALNLNSFVTVESYLSLVLFPSTVN